MLCMLAGQAAGREREGGWDISTHMAILTSLDFNPCNAKSIFN